MLHIKDDVAMTARDMDTIKPGWFWLVDVERLDMMDHENCIMGQVFDSYILRRTLFPGVVAPFVEGGEYWKQEIAARKKHADWPLVHQFINWLKGKDAA